MGFITINSNAQLSTNPDKFLGNITTGWSSDMDHQGFIFSNYWNQVTPENATKWGSVQEDRSKFNWDGADKAFKYAKSNGFPFKFHTFIWGAQFPGWIKNLSQGERYTAIINWMDEAKRHFPNLEVIDVVNEAIDGHQQDTPIIKEALGGGGKTGYDWIIKAFELVHERWPNAILVYNDYNVLRWDKEKFVILLKALCDAGAPIDAYGCQAHSFTLNEISKNELQNNMAYIQNAIKIPMYITEYDINFNNDADQKRKYEEQIPLFWEADYCADVTLWGWFLGSTWAEYTGLISNGQEREALKWLRTYMQTDAAKNAKSPFPGMKKEASIYIRPAALKVASGDVLPIKVRAKMATKTIDNIKLYVGSELIATMTEAPYITEYTASSTGQKTLKAVVTTTDGSTYERLSRIQVLSGTTKREPYNETVPELPTTINADEFDQGLSGISYYNVSRQNYTTTALKNGAWMEYTVDVKEDGLYSMEVEVASTTDGGMFHLSEYGFDNLTFHTNITQVPNTGSTTTFQTLRCPMMKPLTAGRHTFCLNIDKGGFYIKSMTFKALPEVELPGTLEAEDFTNGDGVNIISGNGGLVLGNTTSGEWVEYAVNITEPGKFGTYSYEATVSSAVEGSSFIMTLIESDGTEKSLGTVTVPNTGSLNTYQVKTGKIFTPIKKGKQTLRINIVNGGCNIDKLKLICATGIISAETERTTTEAQWFSPDGRRLSAPQKGLNLERTVINGQTVTRKVIR